MILDSKVALITGGARGIGAGIAKEMHAQGAFVIICDIDPEAGKAMVEKLGKGAQFHTLDVTDEKQITDKVQKIIDDHQKIDILVNNAGITNDKLLMRMSREDWQRVIDVNLTGTFILTKAVIRNMIKQRSGRIISISSVVGLVGNAGQTNYAASKAGIIGFTKACAKEVATRNITVNAVAPGFIETAMTDVLSDEMKKIFKQSIPMKKFGKIEDVAQLVVFLSSDQASYITGQVICIDGGMVM